MGRRVRSSSSNVDVHGPQTQTLFYLSPSLAVVSLAAMVAILSTLCAFHRRKAGSTLPTPKPSTTSPHPSPELMEQAEGVSSAAPDDIAEGANHPASPSTEADPMQRPLQKPPILVAREEGGAFTLKHSASVTERKSTSSRKKLSAANLSMKLPRALSRIASRRTERQKGQQGEDLLWKKTIIMGEKCRALSDGEDDDEAGNGLSGRERSHSRRRAPSSLPVSRTNSFSEINAPTSVMKT